MHKRINGTSVQDIPAVYEHLSRREMQVLRLMALGHDNQYIAQTLSLSLGTVKNYISGIYLKLQVETRAQAVSWIWQHGQELFALHTPD